jgi:cell division protein FtsB
LLESISTLWHKRDLIVQTQPELDKEKSLQTMLSKQSLAQAKDPLYLEQQARNKLFLIKPGEQEVVIPAHN